MPYEVYLKKGEEKRILAGHSWVYANEVAKILGKDKNGSLATVYSSEGRFIGKGYINHLSKILIRIFIRNEGETDDKAMYLARLRAADSYRRSLGYESCYRLCFAEADNLPALIIDKYEDTYVIQCLSLGVDRQKKLITECLVELFSPKCVYERSDVGVRANEGLTEEKGVLFGELAPIIVTENGLKMSIDVENGQKTGYFLDQKENRAAIRRYCVGRTVLDCFCNSGGFSVNAATVAKSVLSVDISERALENVKENAALNGFSSIETLEGDVFAVLRKFKAEGRKFGVVVLDPPAFCKTANEVKDAYRGYRDINILGMKLVEIGGWLVTSSCSHYMSLPLFQKMLTEAATSVGRNVRFVEIKAQAPDHPSLLCAEETQYLKFFILQVI